MWIMSCFRTVMAEIKTTFAIWQYTFSALAGGRMRAITHILAGFIISHAAISAAVTAVSALTKKQTLCRLRPR